MSTLVICFTRQLMHWDQVPTHFVLCFFCCHDTVKRLAVVHVFSETEMIWLGPFFCLLKFCVWQLFLCCLRARPMARVVMIVPAVLMIVPAVGGGGAVAAEERWRRRSGGGGGTVAAEERWRRRSGGGGSSGGSGGGGGVVNVSPLIL
jgi:uncharacterized membrane protein YgcG